MWRYVCRYVLRSALSTLPPGDELAVLLAVVVFVVVAYVLFVRR